MKENEEFLPTRQSLLSRLKNWDDQESWKLFFDTYWKLIYNTAIKAGLSNTEAQDVVQDTVVSVMKSMPGFKYDAKNGSFKGWLRRLTHWRIEDQRRKRMRNIDQNVRTQDTATGTIPMENVADPAGQALETVWDEEWEKNLLDAAAERLKAKVDPSQYQIFDLYVLKGWPVMQVAKTLKVSAGRAYLVKHRLGKLLKAEIKHLRTELI